MIYTTDIVKAEDNMVSFFGNTIQTCRQLH